jgi:acetolactate synthase I/II/III large subunit
MKLSDYVWSFLRARGVGHVFLFPGGQAMHLLDSLGTSGIPWTCCLHEQAAAFAAVAHAEYTGKLGVVLTTNGPGATNAITGCACAWLESAPVLFLSGQAKTADLIDNSGMRSKGPQELDIISMVRGITKRAIRLTEPESVRWQLDHCVMVPPASRKGPVWLDIPLDVQKEEIDPNALDCAFFLDEHPPVPDIPEVLKLLVESKRPAVLVGNGARGSRVIEFLDRLGVPILTTWKGMDLVPDSHPNYIGRPGRIGHPGANRVVANCDLLLSLGARLDLLTTDFSPETFAPRARKIVVDVDPAEANKIPGAQAIIANASDFISEFLAWAESPEVPCRWTSQCRAWHARRRPLMPFSAFTEVLSTVLGPEDVLVIGGSGQGVETVLDGFRVTSGQRVLSFPSLGAMGTGLPAAIGAAVASGRRVVCVLGDGGFQLNIQELETVRRLGLPIHYLVLSDGRFASIESMQKRHFDGRLVAAGPGSGLSLPDITRIALAYGLDAQTISYPYQEGLEGVLSLPRPSVSAIQTRNS